MNSRQFRHLFFFAILRGLEVKKTMCCFMLAASLRFIGCIQFGIIFFCIPGCLVALVFVCFYCLFVWLVIYFYVVCVSVAYLTYCSVCVSGFRSSLLYFSSVVVFPFLFLWLLLLNCCRWTAYSWLLCLCCLRLLLIRVWFSVFCDYAR
jgi:hypothetical protein